MDPSLQSAPLFTTQFHNLSDTLKINWTIPLFNYLPASGATSPSFKSPSDAGNEFWLQLTVSSASDDSIRENLSDACDGPPLLRQVARLHIHRRSGCSREIAMKYLMGLGGPNGTMKLLTHDGVFNSEKQKFGGTLVQLSKITNPAASYLTSDGSLKVYAEIRILIPPSTGFEQYIRSRVFDLMTGKLFTDMTIETDDVSLPTHRLLIASSSPLFFEQLKQQEQDGLEQRVKLDEELAVVTGWLNFLYSGSLSDLTDEQAMKLLTFAIRHQIPALYDASNSLLSANLTSDNVVKITRSAHLLKCSELLQTCLNFIGDHVRDVRDWSELFDDATSRELFQLVFKVLKPE